MCGYCTIMSQVKLTESCRFIAFALLAALVILVGCRQESSITDSREAVQINLTVEPSPPLVGKAMLVVTLHNERGDPIEGAVLRVRGDMSHAGMAPTFGEVETANEGEYWIPFEWTMAGDWILTITATLSSGQTIEDTFELTVE